MRFQYRELGHSTDRTILVVHGWLGQGVHWYNIGRFLADRGLHVIIPDLPNHGGSFHTENFSYESMAHFLHDFLQNHSSAKPILMGHSMGGKIVMKMADMYPEDYEKIIVVDILPKSYPELCGRGGIADVILHTDISRFYYRKDLLDYFRRFVTDKGWLALLMQNVESPCDKSKRQPLSWKSNAIMLSENIDKVAGSVELNESRVPALLVRGDGSEFTKEEDLALFGQIYSASRIVTIKDASHWVFVDKTASFLKEIITYIEQK